MGNKKVYEIELTDGSLIKVTADHMLKSNNGWKTVQEIIDNNLEIDICDKYILASAVKK
jgi:hypothetical protein